MRKVILVSALFSCILLASCDENRVFEKNIDIQDYAWHKDSVLQFDVKIDNAQIPYNVYTNIRNAISYPRQNLYLEMTIEDSTGQEILNELKNIQLFDPKTGKPYGDGLGDIFDHQVKIVDNYIFPYQGQYNIKVRHMMRDKIMQEGRLPYIMSIGVRIEKAIKE